MVDTGAAILEFDYKIDAHRVNSEQVEDKCKEAIEILGAGGGLIVGPGCALPPITPPENVHAMVDAAKKHGRYG